MAQTLPVAETVTTLNQARDLFNLHRTADPQFFTEWFETLPELTPVERVSLDRIKNRYLYHRADAPLAERTVEIVMVAPLLDLAGLCDSPFKIRSEVPIKIEIEDADTLLQGHADVLVLQDQLWVLVIEAKNTTFSPAVAIPQALAYMISNPHPTRPVYAMVTNGDEFVFIKLSQQGTLQ
jgi:predicted type IV restriction endonuclease